MESFQFNTETDMQASNAYSHFAAACVHQGLKPKSTNWFSAQLLSRDLERITRNGRRFYLGLAPVVSAQFGAASA